MKILCMSDLHGETPDIFKEIEKHDLLLLAGDYPFCEKGDMINEKRFLNKKFAPWLESLVKEIPVYGTWGNHDFVSQYDYRKLPLICKDRILIDRPMKFGGLNFYFTPRQVQFHSWAWNHAEEDLVEWYRQIPDNTNVLVVHNPPWGVMDTVDGVHCGSYALHQRIGELKNLKLVVFGHIHSGYGKMFDGQQWYVNAAHMNSLYDPVNPPISVEI